jgi:diamine N-acetyltransferase
MSKISFYKVDIDAIEEIRSMANLIFPSTYRQIITQSQIEYMLEMMYSVDSLTTQFNEGCEYYIFKNNKNNIGFGSYQIFGEIAKLHKIYLMESFQGKGYGKEFLEFVIANVKKEGAKELELNVNRYNDAKKFYEKLKFKVKRNEDNDIGSGYFMNDYVMSLKL